MTIRVKRGDTVRRAFTITDAAGAPVDLNAVGVVVKARVWRVGYVYAIELTIGDGITIDAGAGGTGTIELSATRTNSLQPSPRHPWKLDIQADLNGVPFTPIEEDLLVLPSGFGTPTGA